MIFDQAYELHEAACRPYRGARHPRLAYPFGVPADMPAHEWHVSPDIYQALYEASPLPYPMPNPKSGDDGTTRLFGWVVTPDSSLPVGTMRLDRVGSGGLQVDQPTPDSEKGA